jgi:hypothetical protein
MINNDCKININDIFIGQKVYLTFKMVNKLSIKAKENAKQYP